MNEAADQEDNYFAEQCGFKIMDGACRDKRFDGMPMEETFQILLHERTMPEPDDDGEEIDGGNPGEETQDNEGGKQDDVSDGEEEEEESSGWQ